MLRYWTVVAVSQIGGLGAIALGAVGLWKRWPRPALAGLALGLGMIGGFLGANYAFGVW